MTEYSFSVVVRELSEDQASYAFDLEGSLGGGAVAGVPHVDFEIATDMPEASLDSALGGLRDMGIEPVRIDVDLVNIAAIAERTGVSRQAVRMWIEGERREGFPLPYSYSNGLRTWMWSDVYRWLVANGISIDEDYAIQPLSTETILCFNGHLADPNGPYASPAEKRAATGPIPLVKPDQVAPQALAIFGAADLAGLLFVRSQGLPNNGRWLDANCSVFGESRVERRTTGGRVVPFTEWREEDLGRNSRT